MIEVPGLGSVSQMAWRSATAEDRAQMHTLLALAAHTHSLVALAKEAITVVLTWISDS
jgi:hypothetical protein